MPGPRAIRLISGFPSAVVLLLLMAGPRMGGAAHELLGVALFCLAGFHAWLHRDWFAALGGGEWPNARLLRAAVILAMPVCLCGLLAGAVPLSRIVFAVFGLEGDSLVRGVHMGCAHWMLLLGSVHLGLCRRHLPLPESGVVLRCLGPIMALPALYGLWVFDARDIAATLALNASPAMQDPGDGPWSILQDGFALFCLGAWTGWGLAGIVDGDAGTNGAR